MTKHQQDVIEELFQVSKTKERKQCNHCGNRIGTQNALEALRPQGFVIHHKVRSLTTREEFIIAETEINPLTMEVIEQ